MRNEVQTQWEQEMDTGVIWRSCRACCVLEGKEGMQKRLEATIYDSKATVEAAEKKTFNPESQLKWALPCRV